MMNPQEQLLALKPEKKFFIGIDSDGCAFDTMEIKQKECFCPNFIKFFGLQSMLVKHGSLLIFIQSTGDAIVFWQ
jgi:hypothetical protein